MWQTQYWKDAFERIIGTVAAVLTGALVGLEIGSEQFWTVIGVTVLFTTLKVLAAPYVGAPNTASMLPKGADTERGDAFAGFLVAVVGVLMMVYGLAYASTVWVWLGFLVFLVGVLLLLKRDRV